MKLIIAVYCDKSQKGNQRPRGKHLRYELARFSSQQVFTSIRPLSQTWFLSLSQLWLTRYLSLAPAAVNISQLSHYCSKVMILIETATREP